jgi:hypothetical protein
MRFHLGMNNNPVIILFLGQRLRDGFTSDPWKGFDTFHAVSSFALRGRKRKTRKIGKKHFAEQYFFFDPCILK